MKEILSISEAAALLGVSRHTFAKDFVETGKIPVTVLKSSQKKYKFWKKKIYEFLEESQFVNPIGVQNGKGSCAQENREEDA